MVDSVASNHVATDGRRGTQTLYASEHAKCSLIDRRGFMGIKLYPVEDDDEDKFEIFTITVDNLWRLRAFQEERAYLICKKHLKSYKMSRLVEVP